MNYRRAIPILLTCPTVLAALLLVAPVAHADQVLRLQAPSLGGFDDR